MTIDGMGIQENVKKVGRMEGAWKEAVSRLFHVACFVQYRCIRWESGLRAIGSHAALLVP